MRSIKRHWATALTVGWIAGWAVFFLQNISHFRTLSANEWGDVWSGAIAPLAFFWLIVGYHLQRKELELQRNELQRQRKESHQQRLAVERSAKAQEVVAAQATSQFQPDLRFSRHRTEGVGVDTIVFDFKNIGGKAKVVQVNEHRAPGPWEKSRIRYFPDAIQTHDEFSIHLSPVLPQWRSTVFGFAVTYQDGQGEYHHGVLTHHGTTWTFDVDPEGGIAARTQLTDESTPQG